MIGVTAGTTAVAVTEADWAAAVATVSGLPRTASVVLACHINPDGDALGSMLGFGLGLRQLGFVNVRASFGEPYNLVEVFGFLPGQDLLVPPAQTDPAPDLMVTFDAASLSRLAELASTLDAAGTSIVLDHHASNPGFGAIRLIDPTAAATAQVAATLLERLGVTYDEPIATCLYTGLSTDTGSFKFDATTPAVHELAARLIATGLRPAELSRQLFDSRPFGAVRLLGEVLDSARLDPAGARGRGIVYAHADLAGLARHNQPAHVLESFIDVVRTVAEADVACLAKPIREDEWSVSLRSKGANDVAAVAMALGGGGHRLAAGFTWRGTLADLFAAVDRELSA
ncbi:bifunctional oligoribonuclease/PAP phosphatase NrnA [Luedemannella helvata]|uniref:Bifunctional oligoribonuclease/PAP phosphatase NrnA n=1 Tax=Luedemannella helvata TaxID=349315 RepID=A0ABP4WRF8_9ACTN